MKSKNKVLLIALMLIASIFCSSCIIVHDWDDWGEYNTCDVYYYSDVNNAWNNSILTNIRNNNGYFCSEASNTEFLNNTTGKTAYRWSRNDIETFLSQKGLNYSEKKNATDFFLSKRYNHAVIYIQSDSFTVTALVR